MSLCLSHPSFPLSPLCLLSLSFARVSARLLFNSPALLISLDLTLSLPSPPPSAAPRAPSFSFVFLSGSLDSSSHHPVVWCLGRAQNAAAGRPEPRRRRPPRGDRQRSPRVCAEGGSYRRDGAAGGKVTCSTCNLSWMLPSAACGICTTSRRCVFCWGRNAASQRASR